MKSRIILSKIVKLGKNRVFCRTFLITILIFLIFFFKRKLAIDLLLIIELVLIDILFSKCSKKKKVIYNSKSSTNLNLERSDIELKKFSTDGSNNSLKQHKTIRSLADDKKSRKIGRKKSKGYGWTLTIIASLILIFTTFYESWITNIIYKKYSNEQEVINLMDQYSEERKYYSRVFKYNPPINLPVHEFSNWLLTNWSFRSISNLPISFSDYSNAKTKGIEYIETEFDTFINLKKSSLSNLINNEIANSKPEYPKISIDSVSNISNFNENDRISVVIPAYNEDEFISKTVMYTIEATPTELLREIIVVDDNSEKPVYEILEEELPVNYRRYVKIIRLKKCEGLIRSKIIGADAALGPNIFFLDGHCKPKKGWSEALVKSIRENYKRIVCPIVQSISNIDWSDIGTAGAKMMIEWNFAFHWYDDGLPEIPIASGGILMITKRWWEESGKYDPGMLYWGGENIEQSFRVWLCGGEIHVVRNSLVGHIFERNSSNKRSQDFQYKKMLIDNMNSNHQRTAFVWLSEQFYETYFKNYHVLGYLPASYTKGLSERLSLKHTLKCKPFEWYVEKFRPAFERQRELYYDFHHIQHLKSRLCLSILNKQRDQIDIGKTEIEIPMTVVPNDVSRYNIKTTTDYDILALKTCNYLDESQKWSFILGNRMLYNFKSKKCLDRASSINLIEKTTKDFTYFSKNNFESSNKLELPLLYECDWNLVMRARNYNQFWAWKNEDDKNGRIVNWSGDEHRSNITGGAEEFVVPINKGIDNDSYCLYSNATFGSYKETKMFYRDCETENNYEEISFKKIWRQNFFR
ncbi:membrane-associated with a family 1 glycosyltransferase domain and a ricin domain with 3 transmembraned domains near C-terminus [Cryptosporidium sp. chipmunk genotype I]|uniref:membrane-associated with a family 1 glycosyltransferase domain and a ricin domain with 3 transmembraned domains near C-terminus n=1 Tax=Cryptosporidium sp. chipmunk genotype I TaxID=1280935 RepID=UPI00351A34C5|nr:membrane-associated with a family 1 glycosyltransferase domain and a ricin domain with 3 transmembraned domains near C-terminus [Cryptosporidium sp. chipmunk genotype I]